MRSVILIAVGFLTACAQTGPTYDWVHPEISGEEAANQKTVDSAECLAQAYQAITLPDLPASIKQETKVVVDGEDHPPDRGFFFGQNERPINTIVEENAASREARRRSRQVRQEREAAVGARNKLADACMIKRGWRKITSEEQ